MLLTKSFTSHGPGGNWKGHRDLHVYHIRCFCEQHSICHSVESSQHTDSSLTCKFHTILVALILEYLLLSPLSFICFLSSVPHTEQKWQEEEALSFAWFRSLVFFNISWFTRPLISSAFWISPLFFNSGVKYKSNCTV